MYGMIAVKDSVFILECGQLNPEEHVHYCSLLEELTMGLKWGTLKIERKGKKK